MMALVELEGYYKENLAKLIKRMENSIDQTLEVIDKEIDEKITDDKYINILKARKQAAEDVIWFMKRIGELKKELLGIVDEDESQVGTPSNLAKRRAQNRNDKKED